VNFFNVTKSHHLPSLFTFYSVLSAVIEESVIKQKYANVLWNDVKQWITEFNLFHLLLLFPVLTSFCSSTNSTMTEGLIGFYATRFTSSNAISDSGLLTNFDFYVVAYLTPRDITVYSRAGQLSKKNELTQSNSTRGHYRFFPIQFNSIHKHCSTQFKSIRRSL
jgi:hypothetical protein